MLLILNLCCLFNVFNFSAWNGLLFSGLLFRNSNIAGDLYVLINFLAHMLTCLMVMLILFRSKVVDLLF